MQSTNLQVFVVFAESKAATKNAQFLIEAESHRDAWRVAREVCRTGRGALVRDPVSQQLEPFPLAAGQQTVKRVLSTTRTRRGRPPKLTTDDLRTVAESRGDRVSQALERVLGALNG